MYMEIGLIAFLVSGFFLLKGLSDFFMRKRDKKCFVIAIGAFAVFLAAIFKDPAMGTEAANEDKRQNGELKTEESSVQQETEIKMFLKKEEAGEEDQKAVTAPTRTNSSAEPTVTKVVDDDTIEVLVNGKIETFEKK